MTVAFREITGGTAPENQWLAAHTPIESRIGAEQSSTISAVRFMYNLLVSESTHVPEAPVTALVCNNVGGIANVFMPDTLPQIYNVWLECQLAKYRNQSKPSPPLMRALTYTTDSILSDHYCTFTRLFFPASTTFYVYSHSTSFVLFDPAQPYSVPSDPFEGYENFESPNWDGYDAQPVTKETVQAARRLLGLIPRDFPDPDIAPGSDGGIGFEWVLENSSIRKLFIDIGPGATWSAYWRLASGAKGNSPRRPMDSETPQKVAAIFHQLGVINASSRW